MNTATLMWPRYPDSTTDMWLIKRCSLRSQINFGTIWQVQGSLVTQECFVHQAQLPLDVSGGSNSISVLAICSLIYRHFALMDMFTALLHPYRDHNIVHREATFIALSKNNLPFRGRGYYLTAHVRKKEKQSFSDNYTLRFIT